MMYADSMSFSGDPVRGNRVARRGGRGQAPLIEDLGPVRRRHSTASDPTESGGGRRVVAIVVAALVLFGIILSSVLHIFHTGSSTSSVAVARSAVVFVIDGIGPNDFRDGNMPVLQALRRTGVTYTHAWSGIFQTSTESANATLATGSFPRVHGVLGPAWQDSRQQGISQALNPSQVLLGSLDQVMESANVTPLAAVLKAKDRRAGTLSVAGSCAASSAAGTWAADYVLCASREAGQWRPASVAGHEAPATVAGDASLRLAVARGKRLAPALEGWSLGKEDDWITACAIETMRVVRPALTVIDYPEIGNLLASSPPAFRPTMLRTLLEGIDRDMGRVLRYERSIRNSSHVLYAITSNGASAPASTRLASATIRDAVVAAGGETTFVTGDSAVMVGLRDRLQTDPVAQALQSESIAGVDAVYVKQQSGSTWRYQLRYDRSGLPRGYRHALDVLVSTVAAPQSGDLALVLGPHTLLRHSAQTGFQANLSTIGAQWTNQNIPLILSGPGTYQGIESSFPARLVDVAPTLEALLRVPVQRSDGLLLADAMPEPPAGTLDAQKSAARGLRDLIRPLVRRSGLVFKD